MSRISRRMPLLAAALLALAAVPCMADSMRCGSHLVVDGDTAGKVRSRCGDPVAKTRSSLLRPPLVWIRGRAVYAGHGNVEVPVEVWEYNFGPNRLIRRVRIVDGLVESIDTLGYGYP